jgi:hypothetical protein
VTDLIDRCFPPPTPDEMAYADLWLAVHLGNARWPQNMPYPCTVACTTHPYGGSGRSTYCKPEKCDSYDGS